MGDRLRDELKRRRQQGGTSRHHRSHEEAEARRQAFKGQQGRKAVFPGKAQKAKQRRLLDA